jgi:hypothetical protein
MPAVKKRHPVALNMHVLWGNGGSGAKVGNMSDQGRHVVCGTTGSLQPKGGHHDRDELL